MRLPDQQRAYRRRDKRLPRQQPRELLWTVRARDSERREVAAGAAVRHADSNPNANAGDTNPNTGNTNTDANAYNAYAYADSDSDNHAEAYADAKTAAYTVAAPDAVSEWVKELQNEKK